MADGHTGGFNTGIKVARGPTRMTLGYLVEGDEASFWLHVHPPDARAGGAFTVADALKLLGFSEFDNCSLVGRHCYCLELRGKEPVRPLAGAPIEARFDAIARELPALLDKLVEVGGGAASLGLSLKG